MINKKIKVAIIDYEMSNLFSVENACIYVGMNAFITKNKNEILNSNAVILPGVGAFSEAMNNLKKLDLIEPIKDFIMSGKPFMGVCLGLQLLFTESEEFGNSKGLNIINGNVKKFLKINSKNEVLKVPQIGWNSLYKPLNESNIWDKSPLKNTKNNEYMYFVHSFYVSPTNRNSILSLTNYEGIEYCSSILEKNIFAAQFHPEKSAIEGIKIYEEWAKTIIN